MKCAVKMLFVAVVAMPCALFAKSDMPVVAIPDYLPTNGMVSAKRSMTEAILKAGCLPVVLPEMDDAAADQFLANRLCPRYSGRGKSRSIRRMSCAASPSRPAFA